MGIAIVRPGQVVERALHAVVNINSPNDISLISSYEVYVHTVDPNIEWNQGARVGEHREAGPINIAVHILNRKIRRVVAGLRIDSQHPTMGIGDIAVFVPRYVAHPHIGNRRARWVKMKTVVGNNRRRKSTL